MVDATKGEQLFLIVNHLFAGGAGQRIILHQKNGFLGTYFLAIAAKDAAQHVDLEFLWRFLDVADFRRARWAGGIDANGFRRAYELAELASDAFDAAFGVAAEIGRAAITFRHDPLFLPILHGDFLFEEVAQRDFQPAEDSGQVKPFPPGQIWALNNHKLRVHKITAVTKIFAGASGINLRQPRSINWSYRKRGHIQRTQIITISSKAILPRKIPMCARPRQTVSAASLRPNHGSVQPPRKSVTIMAEAAIMFAYSPMKKSANFIELYSVL